MPIRIDFNLNSRSDEWLRQQITGIAGLGTALDIVPRRTQTVIVETPFEADTLISRLANLKNQRRLPYGGCTWRHI